MRDRNFQNRAERNPITQAAHQRQVLWQITLPSLLGVILLIVLSVLIALSSRGQQRLWADVALIFILLPPILLSVLLVILLGGLVYGIIWLSKNIPIYTFQAQNFMIKIETTVLQVADKVVEPILKVEEFRAGLRRFFGK